MEFSQKFIDGLKVEDNVILNRIVAELGVTVHQVSVTVQLLREGSTIPFISRYRKEMTGSLDETQVREISHQLSYLENLESRRIEIIRSVYSQNKLSEDLYTNILKCQTITELESLYAPYKRKKKTRAMLAIERGLEPLAEFMLISDDAVEIQADSFVNEEKGVKTRNDALQGAMDIIAEKIVLDMDNRKAVMKFLLGTADMVVTGEKDEEKSVYKMYYNYRQSLKNLKPHHVLAINRGEKEGELKSKIEFDFDQALSILESRAEIHNDYHKKAIQDGLKRLLIPSLEREVRSNLADLADTHGISVFSKNLKDLLMSPPIRKTRVMGVDPGIRTGTKIALLDETGKYLSYFLVYQRKAEETKRMIIENAKKYGVELIAVGNGTGTRDVQKVVADAIQDGGLNAQYTVVSEDGASVYSASEVAREEFPELDLTVRGAISIGRRLQDPLAELVKIDPQSIGVGLYQHDLNQKSLSHSLDEVVESVVNNVGVNLNTASFSLLRYVSGVSLSMAKNIVEYREQKGEITDRSALKNIPGMGPKTFEQCAGFLKIPESKDPLDNTWVHPENYEIARTLLTYLKEGNEPDKVVIAELMEKYGVGKTTIKDILDELKKPNRDPREDYPQPILQNGVVEFSDLKEGMKVTGKVKNVVDFGAFVDIGIKETGFVHISQMSDQYVEHPMDVLKVGDVKEFRIIEIDEVRKRIALSLKNGEQIAKTTSSKPKVKLKGDQKAFVSRKSGGLKGSSVNGGNGGKPFTYNPFKDLL